ncbi:hypothetical protein [Edwardsiella phage MSW-3]|uniref:Uncharacterized protein n=1 Tax=Edwardsiella phage MSW-3 TaxID=1264700 RepID=L0MXZ6_9CAUD|nr:hypothetical protein G428_gp31 [Edwardsiella phage MSW-3]BAM68852.1 hypothetical protein [Edwardsiella phage MSW-3]
MKGLSMESSPVRKRAGTFYRDYKVVKSIFKDIAAGKARCVGERTITGSSLWISRPSADGMFVLTEYSEGCSCVEYRNKFGNIIVELTAYRSPEILYRVDFSKGVTNANR